MKALDVARYIIDQMQQRWSAYKQFTASKNALLYTIRVFNKL